MNTAEADFEAARALFATGLAHLQAGAPAAAEAALRASLERLPGRASTQLNLAVALLQQDRAADALPLLEAVLAQNPQDADALGHRAVALGRLQRHDEAAALLQQLVQAAPGRHEAWFHLGQAQQVRGQFDAALDALDRCLALQPGHGPAWSRRGTVLHMLGRHDEAAASFRQALAHGDDAALNGYYLGATGATSAPGSAPAHYVQRLFDDYAGSFDRHLVDELGYCAPDTLQRLLIGLGRAAYASVLDLGCGTGLCGPLLRPLSGRLEGVDLSAAMLKVAAQRGVYDTLHQAELLQHLVETKVRHDLLVAADVFIYLGDLAPLFARLPQVLAPGAVFAFSVEPGAADTLFSLQPSLRYAHGERALHTLATTHGLHVLKVENGPLRLDRVHPVAGQYWLLRKT